MFIANDKKTGARIDITILHNPRTEIEKGQCVCPYCGGDLFIKDGLLKTAHFAHYSACDSDIKRHAESIEHLQLKNLIPEAVKHIPAKWIFSGNSVTWEFEVIIPEINRVADVISTFPGGWKIVHEAQLSAITVEQFRDRTLDYERMGMDVLWWIGGSADTQVAREWLTKSGINWIGVSINTQIDGAREAFRF